MEDFKNDVALSRLEGEILGENSPLKLFGKINLGSDCESYLFYGLVRYLDLFSSGRLKCPNLE